MNAQDPSPFHAGERRVQQRLGFAQNMDGVGRRVIRDHLLEQHREFFASQHMLLLGSADTQGRPWVSVLSGRAGFARSPDPHRLRVDAEPRGGHPGMGLALAQRVGLLGIDYSNRRRNRLNGVVDALDEEGFEIRVEQSFGNCPKYIQTRETEFVGRDSRPAPLPAVCGPPAGEALRALIGRADHFYIASHHLGGGEDAPHGVDVSHRGGRPGFAQMTDDGTLVFPDFAGNRFYNTLGNIEVDGRAGAAFIDIDDGTVISLTGAANVDWRGAAETGFPGAERLVRLRVEEAWVHAQALPYRWRLLEQSPALADTGTWSDSRQGLDSSP